jgi:hypothetical protein
MSDITHDHDDAFADRVAHALRASERFDDEFESSLVAAIHSDRSIRAKPVPRGRPLTPSWWRTPRTVRLSPLAGFAFAASLAAVASLATLGAASSPRSALTVAVAPPARDTLTIVRFVFVGEAKTVSLVGDFNRWSADATPLSVTGSNGTWTASVPVPNGRHEYAFIIDGKRWVVDPFAPTSSDEFGTRSAVITVGA